MIDLDIRIDEANWVEAAGDLDDVAHSAVAAACAQTGLRKAGVSLLFCDDRAIQALNRTWRDKDKPTDILSFPADPMDRPFLGDIALSFGVTSRDAETQNKLFDQHVSHLIIHGVLHLLGHDHMYATQAEEMERLEQAALASLGWPDPYK